jgi:hypothetical protein
MSEQQLTSHCPHRATRTPQTYTDAKTGTDYTLSTCTICGAIVIDRHVNRQTAAQRFSASPDAPFEFQLEIRPCP